MARRTFTDRVFAQQGVQTGDGRIIAPEALRFDTTPMPLRWAAEDWGMHSGAVTLPAAIESWRTDGDNVLASGWIEDAQPGGAEITRMVDEGVPLGVSIDLDDVTIEVVDTEVTPIEDQPIDTGTEPGLRIRGYAGFAAYDFRAGSSPLGDHARPATVTAAAGEGDVDGEIWWRFSMDEILERLVDGRVRAATIVDMAAFDQARMGLDATDAPAADPAAEPAPVAASGALATAVAAAERRRRAAVSHGLMPVNRALFPQAIVASGAIPIAPPRAWFEVAEPNRLTPLTITDDGRVYGHVWASGQCHSASQPGSCVLAPTPLAGAFPWFHTGYTVTVEGDRIPTGVMTIGGGHADTEGPRATLTAAIEHYDNVATAWADIVVRAGRFGGWACGAARPGITPDQLRVIRGSVPSGDWRGVAGRSELIAVHQVNHPGYPVARFDRQGRPLAIVAAGAIRPGTPVFPVEHDAIEAAVRAAVAPLRAELTAEARARLRAEATAPARNRLRTVR